jgi:DNA helicase-2/ATP-dependent DNA helicase PcrA
LGIDQSLDTQSGVQLVTAHSAKGLEFHTVFMLDAVSKAWQPQGSQGRFEFRLPDTLSFSGEVDAEEARRRLFYVAMTRAKVELFISYAAQDEKGKPLQRSQFIEEIIHHPQLEFGYRELEPDLLLKYQVDLLSEAPEVRLQPLPAPIINELLGDFRLSISALNSYLKCPLGFYYKHILKMPMLLSESAAYGQAVHQTLQTLFLNMQRSKPRNFPARKTFLRIFESELQRYQLYFSEEKYAQFLQRGIHNLDRYYQTSLGRWSWRVVVEYTVRTAEVDGVPITGTIDKIEFGKQQQVHIVDYKTGSSNQTKTRKPSPQNPDGGNFWRQLAFYKLLYENFDQSGRLVRSAEIDYVEPDSSGAFSQTTVDFSPGDTQPLRERIQEVYEKIRRHDFYSGCGEKDCKWCTFVRENQLPGRLSDWDIEELDD